MGTRRATPPAPRRHDRSRAGRHRAVPLEMAGQSRAHRARPHDGHRSLLGMGSSWPLRSRPVTFPAHDDSVSSSGRDGSARRGDVPHPPRGLALRLGEEQAVAQVGAADVGGAQVGARAGPPCRRSTPAQVRADQLGPAQARLRAAAPAEPRTHQVGAPPVRARAAPPRTTRSPAPAAPRPPADQLADVERSSSPGEPPASRSVAASAVRTSSCSGPRRTATAPR